MYAHRWLVIIPSLVLYLASISIAIRLLEIEGHPPASGPETIPAWWTVFFAITAIQNTLTTSESLLVAHGPD